MSKNSNQSGALLLLAIVLGVAIYVITFFGTKVERTNMSASYGQFSKSKSVNLLSNNKEASAVDFSVRELKSDFTGVSLPSHKMKSVSGGDYMQTSSLDFPSAGVSELNLQNMSTSSSTSRTTSKTNYANNFSPSYAIANVSDQYISNPQNPTKSDINVLLLLDTRAAESAMSNQQGSKRATPALAAKTANITTNLSGNKNVQKVDRDPGDPGSSLPVGEGVWIMLSMLGIYIYILSKLPESFSRLIRFMR
jgi:hypothetical protein